MDIKSKKSKIYSKGAKVSAVVLIIVLSASFIACFTGVLWSTDIFNYTYGTFSTIKEDSYTNTVSFRNDFVNLVDDTVKLNLIYKSEGNVREGKAVDKEELLHSFKLYYGIVDGVITSNTEISDDYTVSITVDGYIPPDLIDNYVEYSDLVASKLRGYKSLYIQNQLDTFISIKKNLDSYVNFKYYIENAKGGTVACNIEKEEILGFSQYIILDGEFLSDKMKFYTGYSNQTITDGAYVLYAGIPDELIAGDNFFDEDQQFDMKKSAFPYFIIASGCSLVFILALMVYLIVVTGQFASGSVVTLLPIDKVFNDLHFLMVVVTIFISFYTGVFFVASSIREYHTVLFFGWACALAILFTIDILVITSYLCSISRQIKCRRFFYNTFIAAVCRKAGETLGGKSLTGWVVLLFSCYTLVCIILTLLLDNNNYFGVDNDIIFVTALFAFIVVSIGLLIKNLEALTDIMKSSKSASQGEYTSINIKRITPTFSTFATDINNIQDGLKASIEEAVKGERMKADLITNVSHDLKTPLTSIISYVDLLDREVLNNKVAEGYVDVLVDKSQRLKQLIEDLIEASKASSGNLAVDAVKINLKELLLQACGEFEEKAQDVNLEFKINTNGEVLVNADGKHMWRIYENLLSNTIKYAMPNSRVYIDIYKTDKYGIMVMKNVSRDEINVNSENLAERFTRGDSSRTTEGSGLGLSIAKSLVVLQKGRFDIDIDGDVFKVTVEMPLWEEKNIDTPLSV